MSENKCPLCGGSIEENAKECQYCGASLLTDESGQETKEKAGEKEPELKQEVPGQGDYYAKADPKSPYSYLPPYYQEEFETMDKSHGAYKGKWNWAAFFFSWIWGFHERSLDLVPYHIVSIASVQQDGLGCTQPTFSAGLGCSRELFLLSACQIQEADS